MRLLSSTGFALYCRYSQSQSGIRSCRAEGATRGKLLIICTDGCRPDSSVISLRDAPRLLRLRAALPPPSSFVVHFYIGCLENVKIGARATNGFTYTSLTQHGRGFRGLLASPSR